jgi:hypothetical protein
MRSPRTHGHKPEPDVRHKLAQYFAAVYGCCWAQVEEIMPEIMTRWGKVRIAGGGDNICSTSAVGVLQALIWRDSSFVRVSNYYTMLVFMYLMPIPSFKV